MSVSAARVAVDDSPAVAVAAADGDASSVLVQNLAGGDEVYVGGSGVTAAAGYPLASGAQMAVDLAGGEQLYAICATGESCSLAVLRVGV